MKQNNIPKELKELVQWVCYDEKKQPYNPHNNTLASVTKPHEWASFNQAMKAYNNGHGYAGVGFVLTKDDPYSFIDLDDTKGSVEASKRQTEIFEHFKSYSEISPSGNGLHIIVKGQIPSGRRRSKIEIYSSLRYMTMTGNAFQNIPIKDYNHDINGLWAAMGKHQNNHIEYYGNEPATEDDNQIWSKASSAVNGDKFLKLFNGEWVNLGYQSQSEADFALLDILAFYTKNRQQIERLFHESALGKRKKAHRVDYKKWMLDRVFDRALPDVNIDHIKNQIEQKIIDINDEYREDTKLDLMSDEVYQKPPGLLGDIAEFIYCSARKPVEEIALAGAMGLMSGICGKTYNVSDTGLNNYILLLADTGVGKGAIANGINKLMNSIRYDVPLAAKFIGPATLASGQALVKYISKTSQCFVSITGEFGLKFKQICAPNAPAALIELQRVLLDLYEKSGGGQVLRSSAYADQDKNTPIVESPAFSFLGETTPHTFFESVNEYMIASGLLPRFTIIQYLGNRPKTNKNHICHSASEELLNNLKNLCVNSLKLEERKKVCPVQKTSESQKMLNEIDEYSDYKINTSNQDVIRQLWNRAELKTQKLAALAAVGIDMYNPEIDSYCVKWAYQIIKHDIDCLSGKFYKGEVGALDNMQNRETLVKRSIIKYLKSEFKDLTSYANKQNLHEAKIIPMAYFQKSLIGNSAFKTDKFGANNAIKNTIMMMIDNGDLMEMPIKQTREMYNFRGKCFALDNVDILN